MDEQSSNSGGEQERHSHQSAVKNTAHLVRLSLIIQDKDIDENLSKRLADLKSGEPWYALHSWPLMHIYSARRV